VPAFRGAYGYWFAAAVSLVLTGAALCALLWWVQRQRQREAGATRAGRAHNA
jgi:hypothetical protein